MAERLWRCQDDDGAARPADASLPYRRDRATSRSVPAQHATAQVEDQGTEQSNFIFGSVAKGSDTATSDIDVLVVSDDMAYADLFNALSTAEETLGRKISPTLYGTAEFERKVRDDNHFVTRVLAQPKIFLKGTEDDLPVGQPA
jgi:predicted nucleotidyltransferase